MVFKREMTSPTCFRFKGNAMSFFLNQREKVHSCLATECVGVLLQYSIMGDKKIKQSKAKNNRRWADLELDCFADVLADPENCKKVVE